MPNEQPMLPRSYPGVMVSSTFADLTKHRKALLKAIDRAHLKPIAMEMSSAKPDGDVVDASLTIAAQLSSSRWIDLLFAAIEFVPRFSYCTNKDNAEFIAFADASAGQQATALLTVLLNQPGAPLLIDQPEDDIDS